MKSALAFLWVFCLTSMALAGPGKAKPQTAAAPDYHTIEAFNQRFTVTATLPAQELVARGGGAYVRLYVAGDRSVRPIAFHAENGSIAEMMDMLAAHFRCRWYGIYSRVWVLASSAEEALTYWVQMNTATGDARRDFRFIQWQESLDQFVGTLSAQQQEKLLGGEVLSPEDLRPEQRIRIRDAFVLFKQSERGTSPNTPADDVVAQGLVTMRLNKVGQEYSLEVDYRRKVPTISADQLAIPVQQENGTIKATREVQNSRPVGCALTSREATLTDFNPSFTRKVPAITQEQYPSDYLERIGGITRTSLLGGGEWVNEPHSSLGDTSLALMRSLAERGHGRWYKVGAHFVLVPTERTTQ